MTSTMREAAPVRWIPASGHPPRSGLADLTVIVPTRDEAANVAELLAALAADGTGFDVLFVDDSDDDTPALIRRCASFGSLRVGLLHRPQGERVGGLGGAVLAGLQRVTTSWAVVMDADLQHPPALAAQLAEVGQNRDVDLVVASRHVGGGAAAGLDGAGRRAASGVATAVARTVLPGRLGRCTDPMSGFFAVRGAGVELGALRPRGFKILMELLVRNPRARIAEVPYVMEPRAAGTSKASLREGLRFGWRLLQLWLAVLCGPVFRSAAPAPWAWLARVIGFGLVGLSGLVVNTAALWLLSDQALALPYLLAAALATQVSTAWLLLWAEVLVFRRRRSGTSRGRAVRFFVLNNVALLLRLPLLVALVELFGMDVLIANLVTLVLAFVARFVVADTTIYRAADRVAPPPRPPRDPVRVVVDPVGTAAGEPPDRRSPRRYLPYRYAVPDMATIGSQVELPELDYFRAQWVDNDPDIQIRVGVVTGRGLRRWTEVTQQAMPPAMRYRDHLGRFGAGFTVDFGEPIRIVVSRQLARSPHVVYTNVIEALLRFVAASKGVMLLHSACVEIDGRGVLISARTDTGKTGTVLRLVRDYGARFLSDDMVVLHPDGRVGCYPKPLTISRHTVHAVQSHELTAREWRRLRLQSRVHSRGGRRFAIVLGQLNLPIMAINALAQRVVPPPKYPVDLLVPCSIITESRVSDLFVIERGEFGEEELPADEAARILVANTDDAYQFPPYRQLSRSVVIGDSGYRTLRGAERAVLTSAVARIPVHRISTPDFSWAPEIARQLAVGHRNGQVAASPANGSGRTVVAPAVTPHPA